MDMLGFQKLQELAELGLKTSTAWTLLCMFAFFFLFTLLLCLRAYGLHRLLKLLQRSFSEPTMQNCPLLHDIWAEYSRTFLLDLQQNNKTVHDAAEFFMPDRLISRILDLRWWRVLPHLFFFCGLAAFFVYLISPLLFFDLSSPDAIMQSIEQVLLSMANGFAVLLAGLACSLAMHLTLRQMLDSLVQQTQRFAAMLNRRYRITTLEERDITLAEYAKTLTRIVNSIFSGTQGGKALTPGALSRALLEQTRQTNQILQTRQLQLSREQINQLGHAAGAAMARELRPLVKKETSPQDIARDGNNERKVAEALNASNLALQNYLQGHHLQQDHQQDSDYQSPHNSRTKQ